MKNTCMISMWLNISVCASVRNLHSVGKTNKLLQFSKRDLPCVVSSGKASGYSCKGASARTWKARPIRASNDGRTKTYYRGPTSSFLNNLIILKSHLILTSKKEPLQPVSGTPPSSPQCLLQQVPVTCNTCSGWMTAGFARLL